jgi:hypothetical protein
MTETPDEHAQRAEPRTPTDGPDLPDGVGLAATLAPDHWLAVPDPQWSGGGRPPSWAVSGRWRTGADGGVVGWEDNVDYRPSPQALDWPEPTDAVDRAVQLAVTGYGPAAAVIGALTGAEVAVPTDPHGVPLVAAAPDGTAVVPVFTSADQLGSHAGLAYRVLPAGELAAALPECRHILLNPGAAAPLLLPVDVLPSVRRDGAADDAGGRAGTPASALPGEVRGT